MNNIESFVLLTDMMNSLLKEENILILSYTESETKVASFKVSQKTYSSTLYQKDRSFSESFSSSMLFSGYQRQYDENLGNIRILKAKKKEELFSSPKEKILSYPEYEEAYGKLLRPIYDSPKENRRIQNLFIEDFNEESIKIIHHTSDFFDIVPNIDRMYSYYQKQVMENGDFDELPNIREAELKIYHDKEKLLGKVSSLHYLVRYGLFRLDIKEKTHSHIFVQKDGRIQIKDKTYPISIPKENEEFLDYESILPLLDF